MHLFRFRTLAGLVLAGLLTVSGAARAEEVAVPTAPASAPAAEMKPGAACPMGGTCGMAMKAMVDPAPKAAAPKPEGKSLRQGLQELWESTGIYNIMYEKEFKTDLAKKQEMEAKQKADAESYARKQAMMAEKKADLIPVNFGRLLMMPVCLLLIWLAIAKGFEPLLLIPIGFGGLLSNIPNAGIAEILDGDMGFLLVVFEMGIKTGLFPILIFVGIGAMTDFGPLIANPKTALLGAAAQLGIFTTLIGALAMTEYVDGVSFGIREAASIGIIGGADGPTAIFLTTRLAPDLLGAIAVAAYSYMALVPIIQPPIMRLLTTKAERLIEMKQLRHVSKTEKIVFPFLVLAPCILLLPSATPLLGALCFGNLIKECGVTERLSHTAANEMINIVTILLGLTVGSKLAADKFLKLETLCIIFLGLAAFAVGTAGGVLLAKVMNWVCKEKVNPLIGSAGVSAVPMAARVSNKEGIRENPHNFLLMHAMGPNVAGVIGSAVVAGILLALCR